MDALGAVLAGTAGAAAFADAFVLQGVGRARAPDAAPVAPPRATLLLERLALALPAMDRARAREEARARRLKVMRQMPGLLDILTLGLSAGLSFDASLELYCSRFDTELAGVFREVLLTWRIGVMGREEALEGVAERLDVAAVRRFAAAVSEALAFGSPLARVLEQQAEVLRDEQRSEVEEEIEKVPVKMLIPLGTLIVPAMLLAILGPLVAPALGTA